MKYVVFLGDGMADTPVEALQGKTPLMVAKKPNIDALAPFSEIGLARTVPVGMKPGSDTANLAVMGYDPRTCYSGRSPLEALSMGLTLDDTDIAVRCNLVTLSQEEDLYADKTMVDYSAGEISTEESRELIEYLEERLGDDRVSFHPGISYRHCLIVKNASVGSELTPPHDITGKPIKRYLPAGLLGELFLDLQLKSFELLKDHPINKKRIAKGKNPANSVWFWGEGTKPAIPDFYLKNGVKGAVISAVDLLKGIGKGAGMDVIEVPGATGNVHTDFAAKGKAAIRAFKEGADYVYIHVEAPDESGHQGSLKDKITSIEKIDQKIVGPVLTYLKSCGEPYHVLVCPDHPTPLATRTHSADPIPFMIYKSDVERASGVTRYDEESAKSTDLFVEEGYTLLDRLLSSDPQEKSQAISPTLVTSADGSEEILLNEGSAPSEGSEEDSQEASKQAEDDLLLSQEPKEGDADEEPAPSEEETEDQAPAENADETSTENDKPKKQSKFGAFFKRHLKWFIILFAVLLVGVGVTVGHFVATYHLAFIRSEEDLKAAIVKEKVSTLVFKSDVTVAGDLVLDRTMDLDLNEYILTVQGRFSLPLEDDAIIGYKKWGEYRYGGKIEAKNFAAVGTGTLTLYADLKAEEATLTASKLTVNGNFEGEGVAALQSAEIEFNGNAEGTLALSDASEMTLCGNAATVSGGSKVTLKSGKIDTVKDTADFYLYEGATASKIVNVDNYYRVSRLAAPEKITVLEENGDFVCYVSEVIGATEISYSLNGTEKTVPAMAGTTAITLNADELTPGKQTLVIKATAPNDPRYLDSEEKTYTFEFSAKLETPVVAVKEQNDALILHVNAVKHAVKYLYKIDGTEYTTQEADTEITDLIVTGGVHVVEVTAQSDNKYFSDSNAAMTSYVKYLTLDTPALTAAKEEEVAVFSWAKIEGATSYRITYGEDVIYTSDLTITLPYLKSSDFTIQSIGGGYYKDGLILTVTAAQIKAGIAPIETSDEE